MQEEPKHNHFHWAPFPCAEPSMALSHMDRCQKHRCSGTEEDNQFKFCCCMQTTSCQMGTVPMLLKCQLQLIAHSGFLTFPMTWCHTGDSTEPRGCQGLRSALVTMNTAPAGPPFAAVETWFCCCRNLMLSLLSQQPHPCPADWLHTAFATCVQLHFGTQHLHSCAATLHISLLHCSVPWAEHGNGISFLFWRLCQCMRRTPCVCASPRRYLPLVSYLSDFTLLQYIKPL